VREQYRVNLKENPRYDHPSMIPKVEWKNLLEDANEKKVRKEGNMPLGLGRYIIF
jgi:hypothetical protein